MSSITSEQACERMEAAEPVLEDYWRRFNHEEVDGSELLDDGPIGVFGLYACVETKRNQESTE
jgi:hypothetical protein